MMAMLLDFVNWLAPGKTRTKPSEMANWSNGIIQTKWLGDRWKCQNMNYTKKKLKKNEFKAYLQIGRTICTFFLNNFVNKM